MTYFEQLIQKNKKPDIKLIYFHMQAFQPGSAEWYCIRNRLKIPVMTLVWDEINSKIYQSLT